MATLRDFGFKKEADYFEKLREEFDNIRYLYKLKKQRKIIHQFQINDFIEEEGGKDISWSEK